MNIPAPFAVIFVAMATTAFFGPSSRADVSMTARQVGNDVEFSYSGSIDLTGLTAGGSGSSRGAVYAVNSFIEFGALTDQAGATTFYSAVDSAPEDIGTGAFQLPDSFTGSSFSVNNNSFEVPLNYVSGSEISGSITFAGKTLTALGIDDSAGPYTWSLTNGEEITLTFLGAVAAPVPDNIALKAKIKKQVKKLKKQLRNARKNQQVALQKKLKKKLTLAASQLKGL